MTDRISTADLRRLLEDGDFYVLGADLAAEVIELRGLLKSVLDVDAAIGTRSTVHDIARAALNHKETAEEMRTCHHCKKQTAKRQLSCTWCGIWEKG